MSDRPADALTPEETRAREALRGLEEVRPEPAFRARLASDFASGRIGERREMVLPASGNRGWRLWRLALAPVGAAALLVVVVLANRGPAWTVLGSAGAGLATVDGSPVAVGDAAAIQRRLRPGSRLVAPPEGELEIATRAGVVIQVTPGTELVLPAPPPRWFGRRVRGAVAHGEIRVTTGPAFAGAELTFDTPEAVVEVVGTTLAVICEPGGTCVCVFEGVVRVGAKGETAEPVPTGRRRFVFGDGRPPELDDIRPMENQKLGMFRDSRRAWLGGGGE